MSPVTAVPLSVTAVPLSVTDAFYMASVIARAIAMMLGETVATGYARALMSSVIAVM